MSRPPWSGHLHVVNGHAAVDSQYEQESADWEERCLSGLVRPQRKRLYRGLGAGDRIGVVSMKQERQLLPTGEFARRSGLSLKALRIYDENGLLRPAEADPGTRGRRPGAPRGRGLPR